MKIIVVSTYPPGKGSLNEYGYHFVQHLRQKVEVESLVLLVDKLPTGDYIQEASESGKLPVTIVPCWQFGDWRNAWHIRRMVRQLKPDVVLFNIQFATFADKRIPAALGLLAPLLVKQTGVLSTVLLHNIMETIDLKKAGFDSNRIMEWLTRKAGELFTRLLLRADLVALTIPKYVEILNQKYQTGQVMLAPHGTFEVPPEPSFEVTTERWQILTFGKFGTYKRLEKLIDAFEILQNRTAHPLELVIAGTDSPNSAGYVERIRKEYARVPNIRFTGYVAETDVPRIFGDAAVVIFPYNSTTGSSGVLHQAGAYGKPAVLPRLGDFAELIAEEGYTGEFFEPENSERMADAIQKFLDDPAYRRRCGEQNYLAAVGIPMSEVVDWYLLHFERLLTKDGGSR